MKFVVTLLLSLTLIHPTLTAPLDTPQGIIDSGPFPEDLNGSNFTYPWPVQLFRFRSQRQDLQMAFMDVPPASPCGSNTTARRPAKTAVLLHGKNFCGPTWGATAAQLRRRGYRVVLPDHIGFCKSSKPAAYQFGLAQLAWHVRGLLAALNVSDVTIVGHSLGGMLAARYALMFPETVRELVLVDPIGLEDWVMQGVPYQSIGSIYAMERASSYASIREYEQATYYVGQWDPSYDVWVNMLVNVYGGSEADNYAFNQALVTDMVLAQPVVYDLPSLTTRTLLMVGNKDNTAIGKAWSPPDVQARLGHYGVLGRETAAMIPNSTLVEFDGLGHAPQIQAPDKFHEALFGWLS